MTEDPRKTEHDLIQEALPLINMIGADAAKRQPFLNAAIKAQLTFVHDQLIHYLPVGERGWGDDTKMPHEWGSMDTYDDMRNSLRLATMMMDDFLDPFVDTTAEDPVITLRRWIVLAECGVCAVAGEVLTAAGLDGEDDFDLLAETAREIEKQRDLEPNSLFPMDHKED